jgi:hypothetical protein
MILFVDDNAGILFLKRFTGVIKWITEIVDRISQITIVVDKVSQIDGD